MATPFVAGPVGGFIGDSLETASFSAATVLGENDIVIGFVQNGRVIGQSTLGSDFSTAMSHERLASQIGVLESRGVLSEGVDAFTVVKQNGQVFIRGSNNFVPEVSQETRAYLQSLFK